MKKNKSFKRRFTVNYKLHCIRQYELSKNFSGMARSKGIDRSTLRRWVVNKNCLENVKRKRKFFGLFSIFVRIFLKNMFIYFRREILHAKQAKRIISAFGEKVV